ASISGTSEYPVTPLSSSHWTLAMSSTSIRKKDHILKSDVERTQKGQAMTLIDNGTSLAYIPSDAVDVIYGVIAAGAVHVKAKDEGS
ncbi:hypothetical protein BDN67DRAFT_912964, partial [Paxillus ammoniavirescens]